MMRQRPKTSSTLLTLAILLVAAAVISAGLGAVRVPLAAVIRALLHPADAGDAGVILFTIRLPRVIAAGLVGAGLSATGVLFQGLFRNPLADPFVLGASGGAALGGAVAVFLVPTMSIAGISATALLAFAGALLTMAVVWSLARAGGKFAIENMLLAGFAIGTMLNAATSALELGKEVSNPGVRLLTAWLHGEISVPSWTQVVIITIAEISALVLAILLARQLNTLALGEEYAEQLGVRVSQIRILVVAIGSVLTALSVSLGGLIGFVGLLVPHVLRIILGPDHFRLLPAAALCGAMFLIVADTIARTAFAPTEIPVGLLTAFIGGPAFLYLLHQKNQRSTGGTRQ
jgi:iron complex transport system permease protein